jgi:hypothetical protein
LKTLASNGSCRIVDILAASVARSLQANTANKSASTCRSYQAQRVKQHNRPNHWYVYKQLNIRTFLPFLLLKTDEPIDRDEEKSGEQKKQAC